MTNDISPLDRAWSLTPWWMLRIREFDALEIHPCTIIGSDSTGVEIVEPCEPGATNFWIIQMNSGIVC